MVVARVATQYQEDLPVVRPLVRRFDIEVGHCWVWLFFVGHPEGFGERHGKSYLTRRRRGEEGGGGGSVTGGTVPSV